MKQELLKWIYENKVGLGTVETVYMDDLIEMINELEEPQVTNEQAWNKIAETYPETAQNLRITLDHAVYGHEAEPQKVKVPEFVVEWFEENKHNLNFAIYELCEAGKVPVDLYEGLTDFERWFYLNHDIDTLIRMQDGYEVEEEPKYRVEFPVGYGYRYLSKDSSGQTVFTSAVGDYISEFTEAEIKSIDERYWPFSVPVEKV